MFVKEKKRKMRKLKKLALLILTITLIFQTNMFSGSNWPKMTMAANKASLAELYDIYMTYENVPDTDYQKYLNKYKDNIYSGDKITYLSSNLSSQDLILLEGSEIKLTIEVKESAAYVFSFDYKTLGDNILPTNMSLLVNGEYQYDELKRLFVSDTWVSGEVQYDRYGNECIAMPIKEKVWKTSYLHDTAFLFSEPMLLYLDKGVNTLVFKANEGSIQLGNLYLSEESIISKDTAEKATGDEMIVLEAEDVTYRNSPNIRAEAEFNTDITPYDPKKKTLNMISEASFKTGGTKIEYEFEALEDGYYNLGFDYRQSTKANFSVYRNIYIDGEIPSESYQNMEFPYSKKFARTVAAAPVYLTKGTHLLTIEVSLDYMRNSIKILNMINDEINELALSINKITGGNTDKYRDFKLEDYGFEIEDKLLSWADSVDLVYGALSTLNKNEKNIGELAQLKVASAGLRRLAEKPNELPQKLNQFSYGTSSVRQNINNVIENISVSQLGLDKILFYQDDAKLPSKTGFFKGLSLNVKHFFASFSQQDYAPDYDSESETLQIWVARPRQYLEIMQRMADSNFTKEYGINVNLSIVPDQQKLILANASGKAPDAAIGISSGYVYDLALRGALANMREFDTFKAVGNRFAPGMLIPGICDDGVYAIPETFNFYVLFYRTDIMDAIGLEVPNTMDEVRDMLPELARRGLSFNTHVSNFLVKNFNTTTPFIFQSGGELIKSGETRANLDSPEVIEGLKTLTENFTIYDMDYEVLSFYQAFRDGRMPIGTSDYGTFNLLINAAPELADSWAIAPYPGIENQDGEVLRYTSGAAESCVVFSSSNKSEAAWKFIDWWTSTEVQTEFAYTLQSTLGNEYLWNSANLDAIMASPWSTKHKEVIMKQIEWTYEAPKVPGSYIIERELGNILIKVVTQNVNIRSAVDDAEKKINRELARKLEEFGYIDNKGNTVKELIIPDINMIKDWLR
jgi:ABC-type glycerol-3-phosphate transport system substrate-binding protein